MKTRPLFIALLILFGAGMVIIQDKWTPLVVSLITGQRPPRCSDKLLDPSESPISKEGAVGIAMGLYGDSAKNFIAEHPNAVRLFDSCNHGLMWTVVITTSPTWTDVFINGKTGEVIQRRSLVPTI